MAHVVGDLVALSEDFGADPTTISLAVTDPTGTTVTYTYAAAQISKTATGVYAKTIMASTAGNWSYVWTAGGAVVDVEDGVFSVYPPLAIPTTAVLAFDEARDAVNLPTAVTQAKLDELARYITGVSEALDFFVGPVINRAVTEQHDGDTAEIMLRQYPVASVTTVTEYSGTTSTALTAHTIGAAATATNYTFDARLGTLTRGSRGAVSRFASSGVVVVYVAGRFATQAVVEERYRMAARQMLAHVWRREEVASPQQVAASQRSWGLPVPRPILELLPDQLRVAAPA